MSRPEHVHVTIPDDPAASRDDADAAGTEITPSRVMYRRMADVEPEPVNWLWRGRIARGKTTMIAGDPGLGKSQISTSMASIVSTGGCWPVDRTAAPRGNVIIISAEDDPADTIRPRLDAAGADVSRVYVVDAVQEGDSERTLSLEHDVERLRAMIGQIGDLALVIIDPVSAYLGGRRDSYNNSDMRGLLAPLGRLAADTDAAIVMVSHLTKATGANAVGRVQGSIAFTAAARAAYIVCRDPQDEHRRLFLPAKNNIGPDSQGLAYRIESVTTGDIETSRIKWGDEYVSMTADDALAVPVGDEVQTQRSEAAEWLREYLAKPAPATEVFAAAAKAGHSKRTIQRARREADVISTREGFGRDAVYTWSMGANPPPSENPGAHGDLGAHADSRGLQPDEFGVHDHARQGAESGIHGAHGEKCRKCDGEGCPHCEPQEAEI